MTAWVTNAMRMPMEMDSISLDIAAVHIVRIDPAEDVLVGIRTFLADRRAERPASDRPIELRNVLFLQLESMDGQLLDVDF